MPESAEPDATTNTDCLQDGREDELARILGSHTFTKSPRLASLLKYICERTWSGHVDELSEQQIGIHFFHRQPGFVAAEDAIVRGSARQLRKRLELYYETEGKSSTVQIVIPKGGYVARFEHIVPQFSQNRPEQGDHADPGEPHPARRHGLMRYGFIVLLLAAVTAGGLLWWKRRPAPIAKLQTDGPVILWRTLFQPNQRTLIVPGDPALNLYTVYKHRDVPLIQYTEQSYQDDKDILAISPHGTGILSKINMTTMADLKLVSELVRIPYRESIPIPDKNVEVRYARDISAADVRGANLVLLGASTFDPWVTLYDTNLDFKLDRNFENYSFRVLNRAPRKGEPQVFTLQYAQALTIVALTSTPNGENRVLLIEGSTMGSIYAGSHFLFTQKMWEPVIHAATDDGKLRNFEVLLKSNFIKDEVSDIQVMAWHVH